MSEASRDESGPIKHWKQVLVLGVAAFAVPVFIIISVVKLITGGLDADPSAPSMNEELVAARIKPVGEVNLVQTAASGAERSAEEIYKAACAACHDAGLMNSPRTGDKGGWAARIAQGEKTLISHAIAGIRNMPPRGGNPSLSDAEVARAVIWMANQSGASFQETAVAPVAPAAAAPATDPAAAEAATTAPAPSAPASTPAPTAAATSSGEQVYQQACAMCHATGLAGAPKLGDAAAWKPRIAQGTAVLHENAIKGIRAMPAKGGNPSLADAAVAAAVDYMVSAGK
ncbi:MAG: cytochrome c5 family protein [Burkholderiales bacterium]|nr:cytochrome c5 family protein [Burkholderiales bacterium]